MWIASKLELSIVVALRLLWFLLGGWSRLPKCADQTVLIFKTAKLGDFICTTPALKLVAANTRGAVKLLTGFSAKRSNFDAGQLSPWVQLVRHIQNLEILTARYDKWSETKKRIRAAKWNRDRYQIILLVASGESPPSICKKILFLRSIGIRGQLRGINSAIRVWVRKMLYGRIVHQSRSMYLTGICAHLESTSLRVRTPHNSYCICVSKADKIWAKTFWSGLSGGGKVKVVLCPGGARVHKRWPVASYQQLIVSESLCDASLLVIGDEADRLVLSKHLSLNQESRCVAGELTLCQSAALIAEADLFIGNDSGPAHISAGLGVETIVIFSGIHHPGLWDPLGKRVRIQRHWTKCRGCRAELLCPAGTNECIQGVSVEEVVQSVRSALVKIPVGQE